MGRTSRHSVEAGLLAVALGGCTIIGVVQGAQSAGYQNAERGRAIAQRNPNPPAAANEVRRAIAYGLLGLVIDVALVIVIVPRVVPHE